MIVRTGSQLLQQHPDFLSSLQAWIDRPLLLQLAVVVGTYFEHRLGHPQEVDRFIRVVKESTPNIIAMVKIEGLYHLIGEIWAVTGNGSV